MPADQEIRSGAAEETKVVGRSDKGKGSGDDNARYVGEEQLTIACSRVMNDSTGWTGFKRLQDRPKSVIITKVWLLVVERLAPSSVEREREEKPTTRTSFEVYLRRRKCRRNLESQKMQRGTSLVLFGVDGNGCDDLHWIYG